MLKTDVTPGALAAPSASEGGEIPFSGVTPVEQQARSFARLLTYLTTSIARYHPYYRGLFRRLGIAPIDIRTYDDFRRIPVTTKATLVENLADFTLMPRYPGAADIHDSEVATPEMMARYRHRAQERNFRDLFGLRPEVERVREQFLRDWRPIHFQMSGGTTGKAVVSGYTHSDLYERFARSGAWWYGLNPRLHQDDKWLNLLPAAPHLGIYATMLIPLFEGQPNFNTFGGKVMPTERQIRIAAEDNFAVVIALPSYLIHWLRTAIRMREMGEIPPIGSFKVAYCVGEPVTDAYRALIKDAFKRLGSGDVQVLEGMSSTELRTGGFYECNEGSKLHFDPTNFFGEILDPETKQPVPDGQPGIFVWSHIDWHGTAILRYWTGDYVSGGMVWATCPDCGHTIPRLVTPIWRADKDETKIRGTRVELIRLSDAVRGVSGVRSFQVLIGKSDKNDPFSRDTLTAIVACHDDAKEEEIEAGVRQAVLRDTEVSVDTVIFESLPQLDARLFAKKLKAEWIVDERETQSI